MAKRKKKGGGKYRAAKGRSAKRAAGAIYMLTARVHPSEVAKLKKIAKAKGVSLSTYVRLRVIGKDSKIVGKATPGMGKRAKAKPTVKRAPKRTAKVVSIKRARRKREAAASAAPPIETSATAEGVAAS